MGWNRIFGFFKAVGTIFCVLIAVLLLPQQINSFLAECPLTRENWLNAHQWTGMYSSFPEGTVNMEDPNLSSHSNVVLDLTYYEEGHSIDGIIYSGGDPGKGIFYTSLMLTGAPRVWSPNTLELDVFRIVAGRISIIDRLRIERENPGGIITVSSAGRVLDQTLRLSPDEHLTQDDLDFGSFLPPVQDSRSSPDTSTPD